jgi:esterase/lipase superfamily enzyme
LQQPSGFVDSLFASDGVPHKVVLLCAAREKRVKGHPREKGSDFLHLRADILNKSPALTAVMFVAFALGGCAGRPHGNLIVVSATAPGTSTVDMLVATTRSDYPVGPGVMFNGERAHGLAFADIAVSIPPDATRKIGEIQWPASIPGDPARDFVTLKADRLDLEQAVAAFDQRLRGSSRHVLLFVHGYNTRFEEAVYRFAQITHDAGADVVPVLFTWPSRGRLFDYAYDRESATYSRDALEAVLQAMVKDKNVGSISVLAHSMGNFVAVEAIRQMVIRNHSLSPKITDIMLAAPDIDVDVFRREIAEIESSNKSPPVTLFVSQDDHALGFSGELAGAPRLGGIDPEAEPYRSILEKARVDVVDLTQVNSDGDFTNHGKFAQSDVVKIIGTRLAEGQTLTDAKPTFGERVGAVAQGAAATVGQAATLAISAPEAIIDPNTRDTLGDEATALGTSAESVVRAPATAATQ